MEKEDRRFLIPAVVACVQAILTVSLQHLPPDISQSPFWRGVGYCVGLPLLPGILGAVLITHNLHDADLWLAGALNGIIYFGIVWGVVRLVSRLRRQH
jgi:hypothetical protein